MTLEDIIDIINQHIEVKREYITDLCSNQHLVLQRTIEPHNTFKAYKTYSLILWVVNENAKHKLITRQLKYKSSVNDKELLKDFEKEFVSALLNMIIDGQSFQNPCKILDDIIYGRYSGYTNEQVPDPSD